jgi:hypothetical protein
VASAAIDRAENIAAGFAVTLNFGSCNREWWVKEERCTSEHSASEQLQQQSPAALCQTLAKQDVTQHQEHSLRTLCRASQMDQVEAPSQLSARASIVAVATLVEQELEPVPHTHYRALRRTRAMPNFDFCFLV